MNKGRGINEGAQPRAEQEHGCGHMQSGSRSERMKGCMQQVACIPQKWQEHNDDGEGGNNNKSGDFG